ncbi:hypothetical protein HF313_05290 [Massilia atriviolacea]|uniref:SH3 domain-containing protein n=1 Tax=Massilia atriviolacea TaxID=2495579 RepID=A0A430HHF4_9BURK|nr:hypothetical protein [Massilia atriviolacea]RSZ56936.1 hypothetical protein EJB06_21630 [Massilia atriviolacea]
MKNLKHLSDFDFGTKELGALRIGSLNTEGRKEAQKRVQVADVRANELAEWIFEQVAHIVTGDPAIDGVCGGPQVTPGAAERLAEEELSKFAEKYGERFFGTGQSQRAVDGQPRGVDSLVFRIRETNRAQQERNAKFQAEVSRLQNDPTIKAMREIERMNRLISPPHLQAMQHASEIKRRFDDIQKINAPFEDLRKRLNGVTEWETLIDRLYKSNSAVEKFNSVLNADTAFTTALKQLQITDSWRASLEHAKNMYVHHSFLDPFARAQRVFHDIQRRWELPRQLVDSIGALSALHEQVGRLTLPTLDWVSAAELVRVLGADGLQAQLSALGINEHGELINGTDGSEQRRLLNPMQQDLLTLLAFIVGFLFFIYQEWSSGKWQDNVDSKLDSHTVALAKQAKQLESLSALVELALAKEARRVDTRFVSLERGAVVYRRPESGTPIDGKLLPREVVTLISEKGKWIEVRYYHWRSRDYATGWVLKKYFTRVPPSRQNATE